MPQRSTVPWQEQLQQGAHGAREASPGHFPMKRFHHAAAWIWTLLVDNEASPIDLVRLIHAGPEPQPRPAELWVQFDASTSGGGAVLLEDGIPVEWFAVTWDTQELWRGAPVAVGDSSWQTFWEFLTLLSEWTSSRSIDKNYIHFLNESRHPSSLLRLLLVLTEWSISGFCLAILGDNTGVCCTRLDPKRTSKTSSKMSSKG